jgi:hypothetical protein
VSVSALPWTMPANGETNVRSCGNTDAAGVA